MPLDNLWIMGQQHRGRKNLHDQNKQAPWRACQAGIKFAGGSREWLKIRGGASWAPIIPKLGGRGSRPGGAWPLTPALIFTIRPPVFVQIDPTGSEIHPIYHPPNADNCPSSILSSSSNQQQITILNPFFFFSDKSSLKKENNRETGGTYSSNSCGSSSPAPSDPYDHCGSTSKCLSDDLLATEV